MKIIRDSIHGYIEVSDDHLKIVENPLFQRLRGIKQTGLSYLVYPGMVHTRFEHSLGTMYLAKEFLKYIKENSKDVDFLNDSMMNLISAVALVHDIGHLPFSHVFENAVRVANEIYDLNLPDYGNKLHEKIGIKIISQGLEEEFEKLSKNTNISDPVTFEQHILNGDARTEEEKLGRLIISNFIDCDRSDYLLRDSYYAGVDYGWFDIERLKRTLIYVDGKIAVLYKALPIVEQFLLSRMYMFKNVYFHSVVGMYNAIMSHALAKLLYKEIISIPERVEDILRFTDYTIYSSLNLAGEEFEKAILFRQGFKRIKTDITEKCMNKIDKKELEEAMKTTNGLLIYHEFQDIPYQEFENSAFYIYTRDGKIVTLSEISPIIKSMQILRKGILVYHKKLENSEIINKYKKLVEEC